MAAQPSVLNHSHFSFQMLKRASSVPTRTECEENQGDVEPHGETKSPESTTPHAGITPSTTDESVRGTTTLLDPLLRQSNSLSDSNSRDPIPHLPNITPVRGHVNYQGWL